MKGKEMMYIFRSTKGSHCCVMITARDPGFQATQGMPSTTRSRAKKRKENIYIRFGLSGQGTCGIQISPRFLTVMPSYAVAEVVVPLQGTLSAPLFSLARAPLGTALVFAAAPLCTPLDTPFACPFLSETLASVFT